MKLPDTIIVDGHECYPDSMWAIDLSFRELFKNCR